MVLHISAKPKAPPWLWTPGVDHVLRKQGRLILKARQWTMTATVVATALLLLSVRGAYTHSEREQPTVNHYGGERLETLPSFLSREHVSSRYLATAAPFEVILSKSVLSVSEGGAGAEYNVVLDRDPGSTVVVSVTPTDSQVTASPSKFNFTTANWNEQQRVTAGAVNDSVVEGLVESILSHKVQILDSNVTWTGGFSPSENISVRVYDDDQAGVVISSSSLYIKEGDVVAYTARLMGSPSSNVELTASAGNSYVAVSTDMPLTFTPQSWESPQIIAVTGVEDTEQVGESYTSTITHATASSDHLFNGPSVNIFPSSQISVVLYDNDEGCYRPCTAGSFNAPASNGTIECLACSPGYYCAGGCTEPVPCPAGTALTKYGGTSSSNCSACPSGHYAVVEASTSCIPCSAGHYCNSSFAGQVACDPGFYSGAGAESCSPCPDGSYNPFSAQASCQVCPAGYACSDKGAEATQCSPGSYSLGNATKCEECPAGYFCSGTGNSPEPCSNGAYSLSNWAYCVVCPAGHYCINSNEAPSECAAGTASLGGTSSCTPCEAGTYANRTGSTSCTSCPSGSSCPDAAMNPATCGSGTYSPVGGDSCLSCPLGTYSGEGASSCSPCPVGYLCADPAADPIECVDGTYSSGGNVIACSACEAGTYTTSSHDRCVACLAGYDCADPARPTLCTDGFYSTSGSVACIKCPAGMFCTSSQTLPQACNAGTYSTSGATECTVCPAGSYCPNPSELPLACTEGQYSAEGASTCLTCPAGEHCPGPPWDEASKAPCPNGMYSLGGASSCSECPKGYYCPDRSQAPEACPAGYIADLGNQTSCKRCTAGFYCPSAAMPEQACAHGHYSVDGASACTECPAGFSCANTDSSPVACTPGTFALGAAAACTPCPPGYFCPSTEFSDAYECPLGSYATSGSSSCTACPAGHYCPFTSLALEIPCPSGYFADGAASNCTGCPAGYACDIEGGVTKACDAGYYSASGEAACVACPKGHYCPYTDQGIVLACAAGSYSTGAQESCVGCQAGYRCPNVDSAEAFPCLSGSFSVGGKETCTECPAGFSCSSSSTDQMTACGEGYYSLLGSPSCAACPAGYHCPSTDAGPVECPPGYYSPTTAVSCTLCPAGYMCDDPAASPQPCAVGYYSTGGASICEACTPGYRCPEASASPTPVGSQCPEGTYCNPARTLIKCPEGTFGNATAAASVEEGCQACTAGYYCANTGTTYGTRALCPTGYFCPTGSSTPSACPAGLYNSITGSSTENDCLACTAGYYCPKGSPSPTSAVCPAGNYCPVGTPAGDSYPCPAGTYSAATGLVDSSPCSACPIGSYCPEGSTAPTACGVGTYNPYPSSTAASACLPCEPGWACPSRGMWEMTTRCGTGSFCPPGTSYRTQYACDAGTYTDYTNLTSAAQCTVCPARKACLSGSTSSDWVSCAPGYYCSGGTPQADSFPCPAGYFTNRTDLASARECFPCPLGHYCGGGGSAEPDGPCAAGYYCPLATGSATQNPCPAGTYSTSTSLFRETQCEDCPPGYYCPEASTMIEPCPAGTYTPFNATEDPGPGEFPSCMACPAGSFCAQASAEPAPCQTGAYSAEGAARCIECEAGHYCGSDETSAMMMYTGGGSWEAASDDSGRCFNGTYCAKGMNRAPDLLRDSCPPGYYCPTATTSPVACPAGTYQPHEGMDDAGDCLTSPAGHFAIEASSSADGPCAAGHYCPEGSTGPQQVPCPERFYRNAEGAGSPDDCALCVSGGYCPSGSTEPLECPRGYYCVTGVAQPEPCPLGTYGNTTSVRRIADCTNCPPGYYCDQRGLENPAGLCDPGYYCLFGSYTSAPSAPGSPLGTDEMDIGGLCPAGGYCPIGSSYPQACPAGTYNNFSGASDPSDCSDCPPGYYCSGTNNPRPTGACYPGYFCTEGSSTPTQYVVEAGYYSDPGASRQYPCLPGTFNNEVGQASCLECLPGYYCPDYASTTVTVCPAGRYCVEGSDVPELCPAGTYSPSIGRYNASQCIDCDPGKYCSSNGLTDVTGSCDAGYYCTGGAILSSPVGQSYGGLCLAGHYCEKGTAFPKPCPPGTYFGALGNDGHIWYNDTVSGESFRTYCHLCPSTFACDSTGLAAPSMLCGEGYYCKLGADSPTPYCAAADGTCHNGPCPEGHYCPLGTSNPIACPAGTYVNYTGAAICLQCPEGNYCDGKSPTKFTRCPAGHFCPAGSGASLPLCPSGTYSSRVSLKDASQCTNCTAGSYCAGTGLLEPDGTCAAGYYCPPGSKDSHGNTDWMVDHVCPTGRYCDPGVGSPAFCPVGTYNPSEGVTTVSDCTPCSDGHYCETVGLSSPSGLCYGGFYCKRGVESPFPTSGTYMVGLIEYGGGSCPAGTYCPNGTDTPLPCEAGTYNHLTAQDGCFACPAGFFCEASATEYGKNPCPPGYYCPEGTRYAQEYPCPAGTYANTTMTASLQACVDAPAGWYASGSASLEVTGRCAEGFYCSGGSSSSTPLCNETSSGVCATGGPCVAGDYCPEGTSYPQACPGGSYCSDSSGRVTGTCFEGYFCTHGSWTPAPLGEAYSDGGSIGDICPQGHFCPEGSVAPRACLPGTYSPSIGNTNSSACLLCEPGFLCPGANNTFSAERCPSGFYCPAGTAEAYLQCAAGQACPESSWEPIPCDAGTYQPLDGQSRCLGCPAGYFCPSGATTPIDCPAGSYCPAGTRWGTQHLCPNGTFSNSTTLTDWSECAICAAGSYCAEHGLIAPSGLCAEGYYCGAGSMVATPDSCASSAYTGNTCVDRENGATNDLCPPGHYCPEGSGAPLPCPPGTASDSFGLTKETDCSPCEPGFYCPGYGAITSTEECLERFYCPGGDQYPTRLCLPGSYCPPGSVQPLDCSPGTYQRNNASLGCDVCPAGRFCENGASEATICPPGSYCPERTEHAAQFRCPRGTYTNETGLASLSECYLCPPGSFCGSEGLTEPEGLCGAGYYCALGATSPLPATENDTSVAGVCAPGYACVEGAASPQPVDGTSGYGCPPGTFCPAGSSSPYGCPPGSYNPSEVMDDCTECPAGYICAGNSTAPMECPLHRFCPEGSSTGFPCPAGTHGNRTDLRSEEECAACPAGHYCIDGTVTSICRAGYFCKSGARDPTPNSYLVNSSYFLYNDIWEGLDAGPCPAGHYCPAGTQDPLQCQNATVRVALSGVSADDCGVCPPGYMCFPGVPMPAECHKGFYCPQGVDPIPCPTGTYNSLLRQDDQDDCTACPAGYNCNMEGIGDYTQHPCPAGHYCLTREGEAFECPGGTYRNKTGAAKVDECSPCAGGSFCPAGSTSPQACPERMFCPTGSSNTTACPGGYYCPAETASPVVCPKGYYCPFESSEPILCSLGSFCPEGSEIFAQCPLGWNGVLNSSNIFSKLEDACEECPPGTYGTDPDRLVCALCNPGYVCLGKTSSATPTSVEEEGGYACPAGYYCPLGSSREVPCAAGYYNPLQGSSEASSCVPCPEGLYQGKEGSSSCLPCSSSSTSQEGSISCRCLGLNRVFQLSDGQCICRSGYEYYDESGLLASTSDGSVDCQPIVFERCFTGEALDAEGNCISESDCEARCGDEGGTFFEHVGLCECHSRKTLNEVCDASCRESAATMFVDPSTGFLVVVDGNSTEYVEVDDLPSFAGTLYCSSDEGCSLFPVAVNNNFSGVYGTGRAVEAAATSVASGSSLRRSRRLVRGNAERAEVDSALLDAADTDRFLRTRAENYRPRNPYSRHSGNRGAEMVGAIPRWLRLSSRYKRVHAGFGTKEAGAEVDSRSEEGRFARRLIDSAEPAIEHPLACIGAGDSVLFDISSGCFPEYEKDSLLNTNPEFDYGEFRTLAEEALSSAAYETFGFVFDDPGTYMFASSCDSQSKFVLSAMPADVSCPTDAPFVPLTGSNLILLGVTKTTDLTLTPNWILIGGLFAGLVLTIFSAVSSAYHFRTKLWTTGHAPIPSYRARALGDKLKLIGDNTTRQESGLFKGKSNKVVPTTVSGESGDFARVERQEQLDVIDEADPEMPDPKSVSIEDEPDVRDLVDRLQKYHDEVEREFMGQKELVTKVHHLLQREAEELKRLLAVQSGEIAGRNVANREDVTREALLRVKTDLASRRVHEAATSASEARVFSALRRLQELLREGATPAAESVVAEIASLPLDADDEGVSSALLREISEASEVIRDEVMSELTEAVENERRRSHDARVMLEATASAGGVDFPEEVTSLLRTVDALDAEVDDTERNILSPLRRLAERLPTCTEELEASEGIVRRNLMRIREQNNGPMEEMERERGTQSISAVLEQLIDALGAVEARTAGEKTALEYARVKVEVERGNLERAVEKKLDELPSESRDPSPSTADLKGMLDEIRDLVSTSAAITSSTAATAPAAVASAMFSQIATEHRRQSRQAGYAKGGADVDDTREEVDDEAPDDVETRLRAEQEVSVAAVSSSVEAQKRELEMELERAGATAEEKEAMLNAMAEDQRRIESLLEAERQRIEESLKAAAAARRARDERDTKGDTPAGASSVPPESDLVQRQSAEMEELRRKHEEARLAVDQEYIETVTAEEEKEATVAALKEMHTRQSALLEDSIATQEQSAHKALEDRLRARRADRKATLTEEGLSAVDAAIRAEADLAESEVSARDELKSALSEKRSKILEKSASLQRRAIEDVVEADHTPTTQARLEAETHRLREEAAEALQESQNGLMQEAGARRKALSDLVKARRRAKETALERTMAGEAELREVNEDLARLEELESEALEEALQLEREHASKQSRAHAIAAEAAIDTARECVATQEGDIEGGLDGAQVTSLQVAATEKLERDLSRNEKLAFRALRERLLAARNEREQRLKDERSLSPLEASRVAMIEAEAEEERARLEHAAELAKVRREALDRARQEAEALKPAGSSAEEEVKRLLSDHRERTQKLREAMQDDAQRRRLMLEKRFASRREAARDALASVPTSSPEGSAEPADQLADVEEAERLDLERKMAQEQERFESEAKEYEQRIEAFSSDDLPTPSMGAVPPAARSEAKARQAGHDDPKIIHERVIASLGLQTDGRRRLATTRLAQRMTAKSRARAEALRSAGADEQEVARRLAEADERAQQEATALDASIQAAGLAKIEDELARQVLAAAVDGNSREEAARLQANGAHHMDEVKEELAQHRKDMQNMLSDRQRERRAIKEEEVQCAGAGSEEVSAALQALDFEDEKEALQLEESLRSLEHTHIAAAARAAGLADDDQDDDEAASAALRAKQHESEIFLKDSLRAGAAVKRSRFQMRVAGRVEERSKEIKEAGGSDEEIAAEETAIRVAAQIEEKLLDQVLKADAQDRVRAARENLRAEEEALERRRIELRELRDQCEKATEEVSKLLAEKKRTQTEAAAASLQERKSNRVAEMRNARATEEEIGAELERLDQEGDEEQRRIEETLDEEAAALVGAERKALATREQEIRADERAEEASKRACEEDVERIRKEHEDQQRDLENALEIKRRSRRRALAERLAQARNEELAAAESIESRVKIEAEMELEKLAAQQALEEELNRDAYKALEESARDLARAEAVARAAAQKAIEEAEMRAKAAREERETNLKKIQDRLEEAKPTQDRNLREALEKKRGDREEKLGGDDADVTTIQATRLELAETKAQELAAVGHAMAQEKDRLEQEVLAQAREKRAKDEEAAREAVAAAAAATALAKEEADQCVQRLQKEHSEQSAALESKMNEERTARERKLRERLEKKRRAREEELEAAKVSEEECRKEQERLEAAEKIEQERLLGQMERERTSRREAQRREHERVMAEAEALAKQAKEEAAEAAARAAAATAVREAYDAAERDEFKKKSRQLMEASEAEYEKGRVELANKTEATKSNIAGRLAKRKAKVEAARRHLEKAQKEEQERLQHDHKTEVEAVASVAASRFSGDITWDKAVAVAMAEDPKPGEGQQDREARVLKSVLEAGIVPDTEVEKCVEAVMSRRHSCETSDLLTAQYKERAARLTSSLGTLLAEKSYSRAEVLRRLPKDADPEERADAMSEVEDSFVGRQRELEVQTLQELEPTHMEQQLMLRQRQLQEIAGTVKSIAPETAFKRLQEMAAGNQERDLEEYRVAMEREKEERVKKVQEERTRFEEDLRRRHEEEMQRLREEDEKIMAAEREVQEDRIEKKKDELQREKAEAQRRLEERSGELNAKEKEALLEQFKRHEAADLDALKVECASHKSRLEQKLAARRRKKAEELRQKETQELKEKEARDAQALEEYEKQTQVAAKAEAAALAATKVSSGEGDDSLGGLHVDIDQHAVKRARKASLLGESNEAKEILKKAVAESMSRKPRRVSGMEAKGSTSLGDSAPNQAIGDGAAAAAAAAAASAASAAAATTATAYKEINTKLGDIEALISALKVARGDSKPTIESPGGGSSILTEVYRDAEDEATVSEGDDVEVVARGSLPIQVLARLEFGENLLSMLGLGNTVELTVAQNLPPARPRESERTGDSSGRIAANNANAFRNSYLWDPTARALYVHVRRLSSSGDLGLVLVHAAAHIQVDPLDVSNDLDPRFTHHFHRSLKVLTQELFRRRESALVSRGSLRFGDHQSSEAGSFLPLRGVRSGGFAREPAGLPSRMAATIGDAQTVQALGGLATSAGEVPKYLQEGLTERLERYAKASGHPRLVELLSRHAEEQKRKSTLSDDEVSNAEDKAYMEIFDRIDGDTLIRSRSESSSGTAADDQQTNEKTV